MLQWPSREGGVRLGVCLSGAVSAQGGVYPEGCLPRGCLPRGVCLNRITDRCKNITFPQLLLRTVIDWVLLWIGLQCFHGYTAFEKITHIISALNLIVNFKCVSFLSQWSKKNAMNFNEVLYKIQILSLRSNFGMCQVQDNQWFLVEYWNLIN